MASRTRKKGSSKSDRGAKDRPARSGRTRSGARGFGRATYLLICVAAVGVAAAWWIYARDVSTSVVVPADLEQLDPQIRAYLEDYIRWVREAPDQAERHATLGQVYFANGQWAEAHACFENVVQMAPDHLLAGYYLALSSSRLGDREASKQHLRHVLDKDGSFAPAHHRLGVLCLEDGATEDAETAFQNTIENAPQDAAGYIGMADIMIRRSEFTRAEAFLKKAFELKTSDLTAHYLLGITYRSLGRTEEAKKAMARGAGAQRRFIPDPWTPQVDSHRKGVAYQLRKAGWHLKNGRPQKAIELLEVARAWHPDSVEILNNLAISYMEAKQFSQARDLLLRAEALGDNAMPTTINLAACFLELGDLSNADAYADRAIELGPDVAQPHLTKANVLMRLKRLDEAVGVLETAVRLDNKNDAAHVDLGKLYLATGRVRDAKAQFVIVTELKPQSWQAYLRLCEVCLRSGDRDGAENAFANARRIAPHQKLVLEMSDRLGHVQD